MCGLVRPSRGVSRRQALASLAVGCCGVGLPPIALAATPKAKAAAKPAPDAIAALEPLNRYPHMVQEYFVARVRAIEAQADKARAALKTKADAERYVRSVQERIRTSFGPLPAKTPLNARVIGVVERDAYRIEKVVFESRPGFLVTANLYVPAGGKRPAPGVIGTCGHSANGKAAEAYQSFAQGLARMGYVVLIYDPLGQGERTQYPNEKTKPGQGLGVSEHLQSGNQQFLVDEFLGTWRAWDGIRALDYLLSRPEVDPKHVGVTGNSGGGTMTTWLCGLEPRFTMAAPSCFVTTFRRNTENELPADTEQCPPRALALGLDHSDFLAAMAPKPVLILTQEKDFFDVRGGIEAYARLKRLYALLGVEENIGLFTGPNVHGYSQENREAMYRWFNRATGVSQAAEEPKLVIEKDETLWCAPKGQVAELGSRSVFAFTKARAEELATARKPKPVAGLQQAVREMLKLPGTRSVPDYRILRPLTGRKFPAKHCGCYAVETEPGIQVLVYRMSDESVVSRLPQNVARAVLYVAHHSADVELREEPLLAELKSAEPQATLFTCDVRGVGESRPLTCGANQFLQPYGSDFFYAAHSLMLDRPYVGQKTFDVLQVLDWLGAAGYKEVHLAGKGWGALPAAFAALLSPRVVQVTLKNALASYDAVARSETYQWPLSTFLPGVLRHFDLPDCYQALAAKQLRQIEPWTAMADKPA